MQLLPPRTSPPASAALGSPLVEAQALAQPKKGPDPKKAEELPPPRAVPVVLEQLCPEKQPLDLLTALRLAEVQNPDINLARERIREALARLDQARALWLPHLEFTPTWMRHDGQIQRATGEVLNVARSSLFVGGGLTLAVQPANALFTRLAAQQISAGRQAGADAVANERLLDVALAYQDLLQVHAELQISAETYRNARELLKITESYEASGKGAAADTARARTEVNIREREILEFQGKARVVSARLAQLLSLPPELCFQPVDPAVVPFVLVSPELGLAELIAHGLANRPEISENLAYSRAAYERLRASRLAPLVPELRLSHMAGGFGGGPDNFFGNFDGRSDFTATAVWRLNNLGLGNVAENRANQAVVNQTLWQQTAIQNIVSQQIVSAFSIAHVRERELASAQRAVQAARESYRLNLDRIRRAPEQSRPIELLQAVQALARARFDYLSVVVDFNRAQFRLFTALGCPPETAPTYSRPLELKEPIVPPAP